jgi:hypothetical protein
MALYLNGQKIYQGLTLSKRLLVLDDANFLALQYTTNDTNRWNITANPTSPSTATIIKILADGLNFNADSACVYAKSDDDESVAPVVLDPSTYGTNALLVRRAGFNMGNIADNNPGLAICSGNSGDLLLLPDSSNPVVIGDAATPSVATNNDDLFVAGNVECSGCFSAGANRIYDISTTHRVSTYRILLTSPSGVILDSAGQAGEGSFMFGNNQEFGIVTWDSAHTVTIESASANFIAGPIATAGRCGVTDVAGTLYAWHNLGSDKIATGQYMAYTP